jgi:Leucine-rich repeat (LRR) protein
MDIASKDVLFSIAMNLELPSLLRWCQSNSRIQKDVCNNDNVWRINLLRDYPDYEKFDLKRSLKETYVFMYQLSYIKKLLGTEENLYDIFLRKNITLVRKKLNKVPSFDLPNLETLNLSDNMLTEVPEFNLPNLRYLYLDNNQLIKLAMFHLPKLEKLDIHDNNLSEVPAFNLPNLQSLDMSGNRLEKIPLFILPKLRSFSLNNNKLEKLPLFDFKNLHYLSLRNNIFDEREKNRIKNKYGKDKVFFDFI